MTTLEELPPGLETMDTPPRILHLVISLEHGGLERLVGDWTNDRNRQFPQSTFVCCLDRKGDLAAQVEGGAVFCLDANRAKFPWDRGAVNKLCGVARGEAAESPFGEGGIDVIHSHNLAPQQYGVLAARRAGIKHVYTQHGANPHNQTFKDLLRSRILSRLTHRIVAVSNSVKEVMVDKQKIPRDKVAVISNGISVEKLSVSAPREQMREELGIGGGDFIIGSVGRLAHIKGYDRLIAAVAELRAGAQSDRQNAHLLLVGDGPEKNALEIQARALGVGDDVTFAGYQEDVGKFYGAMDLFVLPSRSEGLSVALLEAMAAGVPAAVTDVGENKDVIGDGEAGVLLPDDESAWPKVMSTAAMHDEDTRKRVATARERVTANYSLDSTLEGYERIYGEIVPARSGGGTDKR